MAISEIAPVYELLNSWQRMNREDIWHFNQAAGAGAPLGECAVYIQDDREQIAEALNEAFQLFTSYLGYYPRPVWTEETIRLGAGQPWQLQRLKVKHGYLIEFGQRATSLIQAGAAITYSDPDGDGINELATITVATTVDVDEIQVFFRTADGATSAGNEQYQIEPLQISASGGTVTITGHRALFVSPALIWNIPFTPTDPNFRTRNYADTASAAGFVTSVDIYRVYNDTTTTGQLISDPIWTDGSDLSGNVLTSADVRITDAIRGRFEVRTDCAAVLTCTGPIEAVRVYYRSGYELVNGQMDNQLLRGIIRLANANMYRRLCTFCPETAEIWEQDRTPAGAAENPVATRYANNPFGLFKGQVASWLTVLARTLPSGGAM